MLKSLGLETISVWCLELGLCGCRAFAWEHLVVSDVEGFVARLRAQVFFLFYLL